MLDRGVGSGVDIGIGFFLALLVLVSLLTGRGCRFATRSTLTGDTDFIWEDTGQPWIMVY